MSSALAGKSQSILSLYFTAIYFFPSFETGKVGLLHLFFEYLDVVTLYFPKCMRNCFIGGD